MLTLWTFLLLGSFTTGITDVKDNLVIVSCLEQGMMFPPCTIYRVRLSDGCFEEIAKIAPESGIRMVKLFPETQNIAVWYYSRVAPKSGEEKPQEAGKAVVINLHNVSQRDEIPIPYGPVLGGYFYSQSSGDLGLFTEGSPTRGIPAFLSTCATGESKQAEYASVPWERFILNGGDYWDGDGLGIEISPQSGVFSRTLGYSVSPMNFGFDEKALKHFNELTDEGRLCYTGAPLLPGNAGMIVNSTKYALIVVRIQRAESQPVETFYAACDKTHNIWTWFSIPYPDGKKPASRMIQRQGDWLVVQDILSKPYYTEQTGDYVPDSRFLFCDLPGKVHGEWQAAPNTELLAIGTNNMFFRREDGIYLSTFDDGKIGSEKLLCRDESFRNVHWGLLLRQP